MKVFTYFTQIDCLNDPDLIRCWKSSWSKHGWETVVLGEQESRSADAEMYNRFRQSPLLKSCPTNPPQYTMAAMLRWIPMTKVTEPCLHVDWDVMNNGYRPEHLPSPIPDVPVYLSGWTCPSAIYATPRGWKLWVAILEACPYFPRFNADDLLKNSCDQYAGGITPAEFYWIHPSFPCKSYNKDPGWESCPLPHFPNSETPAPRSAVIRRMGLA